MKLDRNKNPDGRGKYALVQMRELGPDECELLRTRAGDDEKMITLPASAFRTGAESPGDMFFVLKYKDQFAAAALRAYARAVREEVAHLLILDANDPNGPSAEQRRELEEYACEIDAEGRLAHCAGNQLPT